MTRKQISLKISVLAILFIAILFSRYLAHPFYLNQENSNIFSGKQVMEYVIEQINMGPRTPGSQAHSKFLKWVTNEINNSGWVGTVQNGNINGKAISNIIATNSNLPPQIIIAAHYDSRIKADQDPIIRNRSLPVPGANDGASGAAVLLELARVLIKEKNNIPIWLVFLDAEDNGNIPGWDWLLGSKYFVAHLVSKPRVVVILDMIGDKDLNVYFEKNSNISYSREIWDVAHSLGYDSFFIDKEKYSILDDHIPFLEAGIPVVDIIDFDYPYWHTTEDTADKLSEESLSVIGRTILKWVLSQQ